MHEENAVRGQTLKPSNQPSVMASTSDFTQKNTSSYNLRSQSSPLHLVTVWRNQNSIITMSELSGKSINKIEAETPVPDVGKYNSDRLLLRRT